MLDLIWLVPALPLLGFLTIVLFGRKLGEPFAGVVATAMTASSFVVVVVINHPSYYHYLRPATGIELTE